MPFSKCLRAKKYSNMNVYFDPQGCQTLLLKESDPLLFPLGSWTIVSECLQRKSKSRIFDGGNLTRMGRGARETERNEGIPLKWWTLRG